MRRLRVVASIASSVLVLAVASCSDRGDPASPEPRPDVDVRDGAAADVVRREAAAPPPDGYDGGVGLGLADVPDTPCAARGGGLTVVLPAGAPPPPSLNHLARIGDRRVADLLDGSGFVVFDADGKNAAVKSSALVSAASVVSGAQILHGGFNPTEFHVDVQAYDAVGAPVGPVLPIGDEDPEGIGAGADGTGALFVWGDHRSRRIRARGVVNGQGAGAEPYNFALGASVELPSVAVSSVRDGLFAVVFSGESQGTSQTAFGRGSTTGRIGDPSDLFTGDARRRVVGLARFESGFALLMTVLDGATPYAMLVLMDLGGRRTSAGLKLVGTFEGAAIASDGKQIGVLAQRREGGSTAVEFRPFDLAGAPLGPWVCLDAPANQGSDLGGGLMVDGAGYSAVFRAQDGSISLARIDRLGTNPL